MRRIITILSGLLAIAVQLSAAPDTSSFLHFNIKNGLPTNNVYSVIQDRNGYLWFATDNGLVKYNGYVFDIYNTNRGLPSNDIWEIIEDNTGRIWFKSFSYELGFIKNGKYKKIKYKAKDRVLTPTSATSFGDLFCFIEGSGGRFNICFANDELIASYPFNISLTMPGDTAKLAHVFLTSNMGIDIYNTDFKIYRMNPGPDPRFRLIGLLPEAFRYIYVIKPGFSPQNVMHAFKMNGSRIDWMNLANCHNDSVTLKSLGAGPEERIYAYNPYYQNGSSRYSSIITNSHLYTLDRNWKLLAREENKIVIPSSFQMAYKFQDNDKSLWYTTKDDGVWYKPHGYDLFGTANSLPGFQHLKFIGSVNNKIFWWDNNKFELMGFVGNKLTDKIEFHEGIAVYSITGNDSLIYISTSHSIYEYDQLKRSTRAISDKYKTKSFVFFHDNGTNDLNAKAALMQVRKLQLVGKDLYGLFIHGMMLCRFNDSGVIITRIGTERFNDFFYDASSASLYCYSNKRILKRNVITGKERLLKEDHWDSLSVTNIKRLKKDRFGNFFLQDDKNVFLFDESFTHKTEFDLSFSLADGLIDLGGDRLYMAGKFGVAYLNILGKGKTSKPLVLPNYKLTNYRRTESFFVTDEDLTYLKTDEGFFRFSTDTLVRYANDISARDNFFHLILLQPVERRISNNDTLRIDQSEEKINLDFINYYGSGQRKFLFKRPGQEKWDESTSGEMFVGSLDPGIFYRMECKLGDDIWESKTINFYVYRKPYWWQTTSWKTIFWVSGTVLFVGIILIIILVTRYFVAKKNERKRAMTELELRAIHSQINPHFIFNTLSASLFFISKKRFDDAYDHVNKFSRLLRAYLKSSQDRYVLLDEEISMLKNYVELQQTRFEEKFQYNIEVDNKLPVHNIRIPSLLLQPLVENAINHGLFHKGVGGLLTIKFMQGADSTELICIIDDNGVGRSVAKKINEHNTAKESYGTKLTNQLLEIFKQYEHFDISLEYTDKVEPEAGTTVTLTLKNIKYVA